MFYYNQMDYDNIKYDNPSTSKVETIRTSGCGVCAPCIAVNNLVGSELYSVSKMTKLSLASGARDNSGTNLNTLLKAVCREHSNLSFTTTTDENKVISHIKAGGMVIANQGDAYNVFSSAGHFVVLDKMEGSNINVIDPQLYSGKYDDFDRPNRIVRKTDYGCVVSVKELAKATGDRNPAYFLLSNSDKPKPSQGGVRFDKGSVYTLTSNVNVRTGAGTDYAIKKVKDLTADGRKNCTSSNSNDNAVLKSGTRVTALEVKNAGKDIWLKIPSGYICVYYKGDKYARFY